MAQGDFFTQFGGVSPMGGLSVSANPNSPAAEPGGITGGNTYPDQGTFFPNTAQSPYAHDINWRQYADPAYGGTGGTPQQAGTAPQITNPTDPNQVRAWYQWRASQPGADPILQNPQGIDYYTNATLQNGGLTDPNYWTNKSTLAQYGGAVGAGGGGNTGYGGLWNTLPTGQDAQNMPGIQFAIDRATNAQQHSAAARGTLLSGGSLKDLADYTTGAALQGYGNLAQLGLNYNQSNFNNLYNLSNLGLNASSVGSTGRPA